MKGRSLQISPNESVAVENESDVKGRLIVENVSVGAQNHVVRVHPYPEGFRHKSCVNLQPKIVFFRQDSENVSVDDPAMKRQNGPEIRLFLRVFCLQN
jgi:hypothetical protein